VKYTLTGDGQQAVVADFNGDGNNDVAVTLLYFGQYKVAVLLGDGTGALGAPAYYLAGHDVSGLVAADLNHDGRMDLVAVDIFGAGVYLGNGDGTFKNPQKYPAGGNAEFDQGAVGDINGDGNPDIAMVGLNGVEGPDLLSTLLGNGDGTFQKASVTSLDFEGPESVQIGDLDGDGRGDLTVDTYYSNELHVYYAAGKQVVYPLDAPTGNVIADANGDGHPDVIAGQFGWKIGVMLNRGDGTLKKAAYYPAALGYSWFPGVGDLNRDGKIDVAMTNGQNGLVSWVLGKGDGSFQPFQTASYGPVGSNAQHIAVGDLKRDGFADLVVPTNSGLAVLINNGKWPSHLSGVSIGPPLHLPPVPPPGPGPGPEKSGPAVLRSVELGAEPTRFASPEKWHSRLALHPWAATWVSVADPMRDVLAVTAFGW
jgi:hypothetical protein